MPSSLFPNTIVPQHTMSPTPQLLSTMGNPMSTIQETNQGLNKNQEQILQLWNVVKNSNNPAKIMEETIAQNPEFKKVMDSINSLGNPMTAFYTLAKNKGVDPNTYINLLK